MTFIIQCAWCDELLGEKTVRGYDPDGEARFIAYSICPACRSSVMGRCGCSSDTDLFHAGDEPERAVRPL